MHITQDSDRYGKLYFQLRAEDLYYSVTGACKSVRQVLIYSDFTRSHGRTGNTTVSFKNKAAVTPHSWCAAVIYSHRLKVSVSVNIDAVMFPGVLPTLKHQDSTSSPCKSMWMQLWVTDAQADKSTAALNLFITAS